MATDRIECPYCGKIYDLDQIENNEMFRERADLAARLGRAWPVVNEYIDAFRSKTTGRVTIKTRIRRLREVVHLWETCEYEIHGKRYRTTQEKILKALDQVCLNQLSGCNNHNYLKKVLLQGAKRVSVEGMTAKEENDREQKRLFRSETGGEGAQEKKGKDDWLPVGDLASRAKDYLEGKR